MKQPYLEGGKVCSAHGVRGQLKVESYCDTPKVLANQKRVFLREKDGSYRERKVTSGAVFGRFVLLALEGLDNREAAQGMRDTLVYLSRGDIPMKKDAVLIADLIGTPVTDADSGKVYGTVASIEDGVRSPLITVSTEKGEVILPDIPQFIIKKDSEAGITVRPIPGFFEE